MDDAFAAERTAMVRNQLAAPSRGIRHEGVLRAMDTVPRHRFVPPSQQAQAYDDHPLPIGYGQTISQPYVVAFMTEQLDPQPEDRVLEIGTGSGYQAAVLAELVKEVYSIEILPALAQSAESTLKELNITNVHVRAGDGYQGWTEKAPFDAVIVTCAPDHVPQPLVEQLREGGRMIIPVGGRYSQELVLLRKERASLRRQAVLPVRFVPMTGKAEEQAQE
jgi:protein-L-isoaspartate(D-aspartate) O-methyltransferase